MPRADPGSPGQPAVVRRSCIESTSSARAGSTLDRAQLDDVVARFQARLSVEPALAEDVDSMQLRLTTAG